MSALSSSSAASAGTVDSAADPAGAARRPLRGRYGALACAMLGAIGFSGKAIIVKLAYRWPVDATTLLMYRMLLALPLFMAMAWWGGRQPGAAALTPSDRWRVLVLGVTGYYLASFLDFAGLQHISAALERLILYLNPTFVLLIGRIAYGRRVAPLQWLAMGLSYAGVLLVFGHEVHWDGRGTLWGSALVLASAISYAVYLVLSGQMVQRLGPVRLVGLASSVASVCCIVQFVLLRPLSAAWVPEPVFWLSVLNATLCTVLPVWLVMVGVQRLGAGLAAQAGMIGPMATLIMGAVLLGEPFNAWVLGGTALVLAGVFAVSAARR